MNGKRLPLRDRGSGLVALTGGVLVFLLLLFFAVQLSINLYARSQVTAAGFDAARRVAGYENDQRRPAATAEADVRLRTMLGSMGRDIRAEWDLSDPETVRLHLTLTTPSIAPALMRVAVGLGAIDRTIVVRTETRR